MQFGGEVWDDMNIYEPLRFTGYADISSKIYMCLSAGMGLAWQSFFRFRPIYIHRPLSLFSLSSLYVLQAMCPLRSSILANTIVSQHDHLSLSSLLITHSFISLPITLLVHSFIHSFFFIDVSILISFRMFRHSIIYVFVPSFVSFCFSLFKLIKVILK